MAESTHKTPRWILVLGSMVVILMVTLVLLEIATRIVFADGRRLELEDQKDIELLPLLLSTPKHQRTLAEWSASPEETYLRFDPVLGWSLNPNVSRERDNEVYTTNSIGVRSLREYALEKPPDVTRIGAFGPSFTHGDDVSDGYSYPAQLESMRDDLEVMNWGVGGYGTDQAYLRYHTEGAAYQPDIVLIGFEEDNVSRNVNRFRTFLRRSTGTPLPKPMFMLHSPADETLELIDQPFETFEDYHQTVINQPTQFLDRVCPHDFFCERHYYQPHALDFSYSYRFLRTLLYQSDQANKAPVRLIRIPYVQTVSFKVIEQFVIEARQNGAVPIVVAFPNVGTMERYEAQEKTDYAEGIAMLAANDMHVVDLTHALVRTKVEEGLQYHDFFAPNKGHFGQLGNRVVAQAVLTYLCEHDLLDNCTLSPEVQTIE